MKINNRVIKQSSKLGLIFMICISLSTCGGSSYSWKEEVLLHDGSKIIATRTVVRGGRHEIGQDSPIKEQNLSFTMSNKNESVTWEDNFTEDIGGANFLPTLLDIHDGVAYLVVKPMGCISYNKWGRPNPPYVIFKYAGKTWQRIALQELPVMIKTPNLIPSSPDDEAKKTGQRIVSAEAIKEMYEGYTEPVSKTILRDEVKSGNTNCEKLVHYKCGWTGVNSDGSFDKKFMDRMCR